MGTTFHHRSAQAHLELCLDREPGYGALIRKTRERLESGFYSNEIVNAIFQSSIDNITILDVHCFILIWSKMLSGFVNKTIIPVGDEPYGDRMIAENQAILDKLPDIFKATVTCDRGGSANDDGIVKWNRSITAENTILDHYKELSKTIVEVKAGMAVLEIGTTAASRTVLHLYSGSKLARWPYGSKDIMLMIPNGNIRGM